MSLEYDFEASLGYWLSIATHALHHEIMRRLMRRGITFRQGQVMAYLVHHGEVSQGELVQALMVEPPTMVRLLDRLEAAGLITRRDDPRDRRRRLITLTARAEPVWEEVAETLRSVRQQAQQGLSAGEVELLKNLLQRVLRNLQAERCAFSSEDEEASLDTGELPEYDTQTAWMENNLSREDRDTR
ncbi:MAG: hypothetical protein KatS3mg113_0607 [Planctomycetaceae bacterium]|nr:MAG: hypothetical protein KatS3mg113_0607 [Planctomycetaceae bacterium]